MADLHNLLDELEVDENNQEEEKEDVVDDAVAAAAEAAEDGDGEGHAAPPDGIDGEGNQEEEEPPAEATGHDTPRLPAAIPPVLAEASRARLNRSGGGSHPMNDYSYDSDEVEGEYGNFNRLRKVGNGRGRDFNNIDGDDGDDDDHDDDGKEEDDYTTLKNLWVCELNSPELLPCDLDTVSLHTELLRGQEDTIEELLQHASSSSGGSNGRRRVGGGGVGDARADPNLSSLVASIYKMEVDRVRFLLADLARVRLAKIENYALHMREMTDRMSEEEIQYLQQYGELLERHLRRTVLNHMPKKLYRKMDEPEMIDTPDLDEFVFCRVLETVEIDNSAGLEKGEVNGQDEEELEPDIQEHVAGSCLIARYGAIRDLVLEGKVTLLM